MKSRNGIPNWASHPRESIVQPKWALNGNRKAEALVADRLTLIIVLTGEYRGSGPRL
jgi:hypothetical protein